MFRLGCLIGPCFPHLECSKEYATRIGRAKTCSLARLIKTNYRFSNEVQYFAPRMSQRGVCSIFFFAHILFCPGSPFASSISFLICSDPSRSGSNLHSSAAVICGNQLCFFWNLHISWWKSVCCWNPPLRTPRIECSWFLMVTNHNVYR